MPFDSKGRHRPSKPEPAPVTTLADVAEEMLAEEERLEELQHDFDDESTEYRYS